MSLNATENSDTHLCNYYPNLTVGITGGIGSGKSVVSRILRCNGFNVYDCDTKAKKLMVTEKSVKEDLLKNVGEAVYLSDGSVNKSFLAEKIFQDPEMMKIVNTIVHNAVRKDIEKERNLHKGLFFIETAILKTSNLYSACDEIWLIEADLKERIQRIKRRDCMSEEEIMLRINSQKKEFDDFPGNKTIVIDNHINSQLLSKIHYLVGLKRNFKQKNK